jgi:hypothetical protein
VLFGNFLKQKFRFLKIFFLKNREFVTEYLFFKIFWQNAEILPQIITCRHIGDHPQEELAKFGYSSQRKVINFLKNLALFWRPAGTYCLNMEISGKRIP